MRILKVIAWLLYVVGTNCQNEVEGCLSQPCDVGEACIAVTGGYRCLCHPNSSKGDNCVTICLNNVCENNGSCVIQQEQTVCICPKDFMGDFCQHSVSTCSCRNGGTCIFTDSGYNCNCLPSWKGDNCDIASLPGCDLQPCLNDGTCVDSAVLGYSCICPDRVGQAFGPNCEDGNMCSSNPCLNGGECVVLSDDLFRCICPANFTGNRCGTEKFKTYHSPNTTVAPGLYIVFVTRAYTYWQ